MNLTRIYGFACRSRPTLASSACGGGGAPTTANPGGGTATSSADAYTGPAPATADVQAFQLNFWHNIRGPESLRRVPQRHHAGTDAELRAQRRCEPRLRPGQHGGQSGAALGLAWSSQGDRRPQLLARRPQRLRPDPDDVDQQLGRRHGRRRPPGAARGAAVQSVGQSKNFPAVVRRTTRPPSIQRTSKYCSGAIPPPRPRRNRRISRPDQPDPKPIRRPSRRSTSPYACRSWPGRSGTCGTNSRFYQRLLTDNHNCWSNCANDAATCSRRSRHSPRC